jgi:hypothetical protein
MGAWDQIWIDRLNNAVAGKPYKLIYLTGCTSRPDLDRHFDIRFDYQFLPVFDVRAAGQWYWKPAEIVLKKSKKFVCLNAKDVGHRRYIFGYLNQSHLKDQGIVSYRCTNGVQESFGDFSIGRGFTAMQMLRINEISIGCVDAIPLKIDEFNYNNALPRNTFLDTYVNIVNETDFCNVPYSYRRSFVTEKTFNAIANNQLFIVVGHAYSLELLRDLGYKTFDGIIDESYDRIENNGDRLMAVTECIDRFLQRPIEQIQEDYAKAVEIIQHNRDWMFSQSLNARMQQVVNRYD